MSQLDKTQEISHTIARIHANILAVILAVICGISLFVMTIWLLIRGGENIGSHLQLLGQYFIGYSVTWKGAIVGLIYGAALGGLTGWLIGILYNFIVSIRKS